MNQPSENTAYGLDTLDLWDRILGLIERDLEERRSRKLFVEVAATETRMSPVLATHPGEPGVREKEIGELSAEERQNLHPVSGEHVAELLLDRHLAEQGRVDLLERSHPYTKEFRALTPQDLPAIVEADRLRAEEEYRRRQAGFIRETQAGPKRSLFSVLAGAARQQR